MKYINSILKFTFAAVCAVSMAACSDDFMDKINTNENNPTDVNAKFIIPEIELRTAQNVVGGDFNTYLGSYVEHWVGTFNQLYNAEIREGEVYRSSTFNNAWGSVYQNIRNCKIVINKCNSVTADQGDSLICAIARIMLAYNAAFATDMFGDTPYSQVGDYKTYPNPVIDTQLDIYKSVFENLSKAVTELDAVEDNTLGGNDYIYAGDPDMWRMAAYGLLARYTMRMLYRISSEELNTELENVVVYCDHSFSNEEEQLSFGNGLHDDNNMNPLFDFQYSREYLASSQSMYDKLLDREDPRRARSYITPDFYYGPSGIDPDDPDIEYPIAPNGCPVPSQEYYCWDIYDASCYSSVHLISYHEVQFLKAEALVRLGRTEEAKDALKNAFIAAIHNSEYNFAQAENTWGFAAYGTPIDDETAEAYFNSTVCDYFGTDPLKEVMLQKYIAFWGSNGESCEAYNDVRRMNALGKMDIYDFYNAQNDNGKFPLRLPYGSDDVVNNPNVTSAYGNGLYCFTEPVWWAGGSR